MNVADIEAAARRLAGIIVTTPVLGDPEGTGPLLKAEHLQRTGSFKLRGAANAVLKAAERGVRHVITTSSGNHGQGVACIAQQLGLRATIFVPEGAATVKVEGIRRYGAAIVFGSRHTLERLQQMSELAAREGATYIPGYDDPDIIAGQGTIGLEILQQAPDVEAVYVPIGGGGLLAGVASAIKARHPRIRVVGVEPALASDTYQSWQQGAITEVDTSGTIADGLRTARPGSLTFPLIQQLVDEIVLVSEAEIRQAGRYLLAARKQAVEPSGAVSVAAALRAGGKALAVISGGNIDLQGLQGVPAWA